MELKESKDSERSNLIIITANEEDNKKQSKWRNFYGETKMILLLSFSAFISQFFLRQIQALAEKKFLWRLFLS